MGPKNDSIQNSFQNKIRNIPSKKYSFNRVQNIQQNIHFKKNEENYSNFQNKAKIQLWSPLEAPVQVTDTLKWTEIGPTNDP